MLLYVLATVLINVGGVLSKDTIDQNVECAFKEYPRCYQDIASLGANASAIYHSTIQQINATCKSESSVSSCLRTLVGTCDPNHQNPSLIGLTDRIILTVKDICKNGSVDQMRFLNSSQCQNKYRHVRWKCFHDNDSSNKKDATSLCCSVMKTQQCFMKEFQFLCPWPEVQFHHHLIETYLSPKYAFCAKYTQKCNGTSRLEISLLMVLGVLFVVYRSRID